MSELTVSEKLMESAARLFCDGCYHAIGIEKILTTAGVSKMTLYRHFGSKDDLFLAVIRRHDQRFRAWLPARIEDATTNPVERLFAIFDALDDLLSGKAAGELGFTGCPFVKAAMEFGSSDNAVQKIVAENKRFIWTYFEQLARQAGAADPKQLGTVLFLEFEGAYVTASVTGDKTMAAKAREVAGVLIDNAIPG